MPPAPTVPCRYPRRSTTMAAPPIRNVRCRMEILIILLVVWVASLLIKK